MLIEPKNVNLERCYEFHNSITFEAKNFNFKNFLELIQIIDNCTYGGKINRVRIKIDTTSDSYFRNIVHFKEIEELITNNFGVKKFQIGFIKEKSLHQDFEVPEFGLYFLSNDLIYLSIQGYCKDHLKEFYEFFSELKFFKENNIDFVKMMMINQNLTDYVEEYFINLFKETGKLEYRDVANGDFNISSGINWTLLESPSHESFKRLLVNKQFGKLPLFPFPDYTYLDNLEVFKLTKFNNGAIWLQLTEDVCPWDDDPAYIQALHTFVDAYIEKRDKYFYSLPIEIQNEMLADLEPNS